MSGGHLFDPTRVRVLSFARGDVGRDIRADVGMAKNYQQFCSPVTEVKVSRDVNDRKVIALIGVGHPPDYKVLEGPVEHAPAYYGWISGNVPSRTRSGKIGDHFARQGVTFYLNDIFPFRCNREVRLYLSADNQRLITERFHTCLGFGIWVRCGYKRSE